MTFDQQFIRIKEAAALLGVTPLTLRNWDKKGLLGAYRHPVNNYRLYRATDIQGLLDRFEKAPAPDYSAPAPSLDPQAHNYETNLISQEINLAPRTPEIQRLQITFEDDV